jgi:hypothetical protein
MIRPLIQASLCRLPPTRHRAGHQHLDATRKSAPVAGVLGGKRMRPVGDDQSHDCVSWTDVVLRVSPH